VFLINIYECGETVMTVGARPSPRDAAR